MSGRVGTPPTSVVSSGRQLPGPIYWGWVMVAALGVTECVSYGVLSYAFAVFLHPMERDLGWSRAQLTGAFSVAWLVAGLAAVPLGRWIDRHGARLVMTAGSLLAALLLAAWSRVEHLASFYAIWLGLGLACAAVLYEPAFAVIATWFDRRRTSALTLLTFLGGLASVVFVPLASWLVQRYGWRDALVWLAAILAAVTVPAHALLLRRRPQDHGLLPDGALAAAIDDPASTSYQPKPSIAASQALGSRSFTYLTVAFALSTLASTAITVHLVPLLLDRGQPPAFAAAAMAGVGLMALPGRLVFTPLGGRWPRAAVTAAIFTLQALATVALLGSGSTTAVWVFVALFGAGFGAITPARAALVAELYGPASYASISGVMALVLAGARAVAPLGASLLESAGGGYGAVLLAVLAMSLASGVLTLLAGRSEPTAALVERAA